ncbi:S-adenosyl-L-methionine-dependent methyltransferase [Chytriomyces cf. hyalinus JEL632]|nr:S-adenosyl-L-methionine-dependent methyltransferase [Chytriomyces cf. hyalinus JEL632]
MWFLWFLVGAATTWIAPVIIRYILRGRKPADVYGMDHVLLNLQMDRVSRWLSMGLWTNEEESNPSSFAEACERLARRVCGGRFKPGDAVADFGCGCGDQLKFWISMQPHLKSITAVTSELAQAQYAASQLQQNSIYSVIKVFVGDALKPWEWRQVTTVKDATSVEASPLTNGSIDSVVSLDACYHFNNRQKFLQQSIEILKPTTGLLSISDIILGPGFENAETVSFVDKLFLRIFCANASVPMENLVPLKDYRLQIEEAGFVDIEIEDVTDQVFPGLLQFVRRQSESLQDFADPFRWMQYGFGMASFLSWVVNKRVLSFVVVHARRK